MHQPPWSLISSVICDLFVYTAVYCVEVYWVDTKAVVLSTLPLCLGRDAPSMLSGMDEMERGQEVRLEIFLLEHPHQGLHMPVGSFLGTQICQSLWKSFASD